MAKLTDFITEERFNLEIREKAEEIRKMCIQEGIPCFLAFGLISQSPEERDKEKKRKKEEEKPSVFPENEYDLDVMYAAEFGAGTIHTKKEEKTLDTPYDLACVQAIPELLPDFLYDRRFSDFINIVNGFRAIPKSERLSSDVEEEVIQLPDISFQRELLELSDQFVECDPENNTSPDLV